MEDEPFITLVVPPGKIETMTKNGESESFSLAEGSTLEIKDGSGQYIVKVVLREKKEESNNGL